MFPFHNPWLWFKKRLFELGVSIKVCLSLAGSAGDTYKVTRMCTSATHDVMFIHKTKSGCHNSEFSMTVNITTNDFSTECCAAILCALHDAGKILPCIKSHSDNEIFRCCTHARNI